MSAVEMNFDGLVGPTHNYSGLSLDNVASLANATQASNPKQAALQGLKKMKLLRDLGIPQGVLPPHERPAVWVLRRLGYSGSDAEVLTRAARETPDIYVACISASAMWTANAATVSPGLDTADGRVHITPANLVTKFHRSIEAPTTARILAAIFADSSHFAHHHPLPAVDMFADEGAANHTRLTGAADQPGVELFVYGRSARGNHEDGPRRYPARQTLEASEVIARSHQLDAARVVMAQQNPAVIDRGVFHNDVIAVGNGNVLFCHREAFLHQEQVLQELDNALGADSLRAIEVSSRQVSVDEAVSSYLFNSQLVTLADGDMMLVLPQECRENPSVWDYLQELLEQDNPITQLRMMDLRESMRNGGGPACLRLRVALTDTQLGAVNPGAIFDERLFETLSAWVEKHYRDRLVGEDLADPQLLFECRTALDELTTILGLGSVYPFQI